MGRRCISISVKVGQSQPRLWRWTIYGWNCRGGFNDRCCGRTGALIYLCSADDTAGRQCISAPPASLFLSLMLPRKGQPFPPERRNCSHTFRGVLQFRLLSAPQRYNTLDFPRKVVCHETAGFFGFFRSKGNTIPSEHPRQRRTLFPFGIPLSTGMLLAPIG